MKYYEVPLYDNGSQYMGPGQSLEFMFILANDAAEAQEKLNSFRVSFPYPAYATPVETFWLYGWMVFALIPQKEHDVFWQQVDDKKKYFNCSASLRELQLSR